jgi:outer membrane immunogenic protein
VKKLVSAAVVAAAMFATPALAAQFNGSVGVSGFHEDTYDIALGAVTGRFGAQVSPNFGVEAEASFGVGSRTSEINSFSSVNVSLNHLVGAYLVGSYPVNDSFDIFGRVGIATAEAEATAKTSVTVFVSCPPTCSISTYTATANATESGTGAEIGVGARYFFGGGNHGLRGDLGYSGALGATALSIGYAFRFGGK